MSTDVEMITIQGCVESITFRNPQTCFTVIEISSMGEQITVVGILPFIAVGEELNLKGFYVNHPSFGTQFKAEFCERSKPATSTAILRYLSSGAIKGIGPATASRIVEMFGENTLDIIEREPSRIAQIKGISHNKAIKISEEYMKQFGVREVMLKLSYLNITNDEALRIFKRFGNTSVDRITDNPYLLCAEDIGFSFDRVDLIAASIDNVTPAYRIRAAIQYVLRHNLRNGHTCLPRHKVIEATDLLIEAGYHDIDMECDNLIDARTITMKKIEDMDFIFLNYLYSAECYCAGRLSIMLTVPPNELAVAAEDILFFQAEDGIRDDEYQTKAINEALHKGILILTGGPGTGKTTTLNAIISLLEKAGSKIILTAPTGRAAKRMSELTGKEAKTIHRLLEAEWSDGERLQFSRNENNMLDCDAVIVDELSMVDILLFECLLRALPMKCRLIMVGDANQLPSVGAGNVLFDLLASGVLPSVVLQKVFRQAMESLIVTNAHKIVSGEMPDIKEKNKDFFVLQEQIPRNAARKIVELCIDRLPAAYDFSPYTDIQVLCPSKKRDVGTLNLNNMLQNRLNPPDIRKKEKQHMGYVLREGDKVMQMKNDYNILWVRDDSTEGSGIFNGDIGTLLAIDKFSGTLMVRFDDKVATYTGDEAEALELAYAITVHKSQGSEFDCVVLPVLDMPPQLSYRNLLYTAVTRAKKLLIIVGTSHSILHMVNNNKKTKRYTALCQMLTEQKL